MLNIDVNAKWAQRGVVVAGGNEKGKSLNQLNSPSGLYVDYTDQTVYVTDHCNHRIVAWKEGAKTGQIVAGGNKSGNRNNQLNSPIDVIVDKENDSLLICDGGNRRVVRWPRQNGTQGQTIIPDISCYSLTMDDNGYLYVSDSGKHEVKQWRIGDTHGTVVAGGNGEGDRLDQFSCPTFIFVGHDQSLYVSDYNNHRVMKWIKGAKEGIVVAGGQGKGNSLTQLSNPGGIAVDQLGTVYVADYDNHRVMRWLKGAKKGSIVVNGYSSENDANQLFNPSGLSLDRWGNLYIANCDQVQKFNIDLNSNT
jgi:sugar lactone lactonase YvrE